MTAPGHLVNLDCINLDHAATTPMRPEARAALLAALDLEGNPSGRHFLARNARRAVDDARDQLAALLGCRPGEVIWTSGGTEADDLAINGSLASTGGSVGTGPDEGAGAVDGGGAAGAVAVCSAIEHPAVAVTTRATGGVVVGVDGAGRVDLDALAASLSAASGVAVVSVMAVNNEVGTVNDLAAVAEVVRRHAPGALLHTDAVQAVGWCDLAALVAPADLVSVSAHKFGGPKGVGALVVRDGARIAPRLRGGGQELGRRSGTPNVAGIAATGAAADAVAASWRATAEATRTRRDRLVDGLAASVDGLVETVPREARSPANAHVCVPGVEGDVLLFLLDEAGIAASAGSSCASGATESSSVLAALGLAPDLAAGALRLTLGASTTDTDIDRALEAIPAAIARARTGPRRVPA